MDGDNSNRLLGNMSFHSPEERKAEWSVVWLWLSGWCVAETDRGQEVENHIIETDSLSCIHHVHRTSIQTSFANRTEKETTQGISFYKIRHRANQELANPIIDKTKTLKFSWVYHHHYCYPDISRLHPGARHSRCARCPSVRNKS